MIRSRALIGVISLVAASAATADSCIDQARAVARRIQTEVVPELNQEQLARVAAISAELCSGQAGPPAGAVVGKDTPGAPAGHSDWFSYFMFGHSGDKPGNKRLKRLK